MRSAATAANVPHSWEVDTWPASVWPHEPKRAQRLCRAYRKELVAAGAISRVGKTIIFLGEPYTRWLMRRVTHVAEFVSNNPAIGKPPEVAP